MTLPLVVALLVAAFLTQDGQPAPSGSKPGFGNTPVAEDVSITSMYRARLDWTVTTAVTLTAKDPDSEGWAFKLVHPDALKELDPEQPGKERLRFECPRPVPAGGKAKDLLNPPEPLPLLSIACQYHPPVDFTGDEAFQYVVIDKEGNQSQPATVHVTVKATGLRWEVVTNGTTTLSSNAASASGIPDIIGKSTPDVLFRLNWEVRNPQIRQTRSQDANSRPHTEATTLLGGIKAAAQSRGVGVSRTAAVHVQFETGIVNRPQGDTAQALTTASAPASPAAAAATPTPAVANAQKATFGGEIDCAAVLAPESGATFVEVGALARGSIDASIQGATSSQDVNGVVLALTRNANGAASFRTQAGFRFALKQYADDALRTSVTHDGTTFFPKNSDDLLVAEAGYLRDSSLAGLKEINVTENRYFIRLAAMPEIPGVPGHVRATIAVEVTGGFSSRSPRDIKFMYGVTTGRPGLF